MRTLERLSPLGTTSGKKVSTRRVRALLAGGLVFGVGAAVTLAAWTDSEFATGTFSSGAFNLMGSTDGTNFQDNPSGSPASLVFTADFDNLAPDEVAAAPFALRLTPETTDDAQLTVTTAVGSGVAEPELSYGITLVASAAACTASAVGTTLIPADTPLDSVGVPVPATLLQSVDGIEPGAPIFACIQVTASPDLAQTTAAVGTWQFEAISAP